MKTNLIGELVTTAQTDEDEEPECQACARPESVCSAAPCEDVREDREK